MRKSNGIATVSASRASFKIAALYTLVSGGWFLFSDQVLLWFFTDPLTLAHLQSAKRWFFVLASAGIIGWLVRRNMQALLAERKQLEETHQAQLGFLQTLIDTIPSPIFYKDRAGRYLGSNQTFENYLGLTRDQLVGKTVYDIAPKELADKYFEMDEALFDNPGVQVYESSLFYADGSRHEVVFNKATFTDKDGQVGGLVGVILDVTERKNSENMLTKREEFLSHIIDSIQDGISILDEELRIIRVNPVIERRFADRMPIVGQKCCEGYHGRTEPCEPCPSLKTLQSGKPSFKIFSRVENETEIWLELRTFPLFDSQKSRVMGVIEYTRDVTKRKQAEDALIAAEKKFRILVEQSLVGTYIIQDSKFAYVNPKMAEIFGYTQDDLTSGISHLDLTMENDRALAAENVRRRSEGEVQSIHYDFKGLRKDGVAVDIEVYGTSFDYDGRPGIIGTLLDVTERKRAEEALKESEERFHQIFAQNEDAIILFRLDNFSVIDANPTALNLYGLSRAEMIELHVQSLFRQGDFRKFINMIPKADHSRSFQLDRTHITDKDGRKIIASVRGKILRLRNEYVVYCSIRDITEKVRLEEEIKTTQAKLIHTNKMTSLGMLVSGIAHEINNPNNYISVNASLLTEAWQDAAAILKRYHDENGEFSLGGLPFSEMLDLTPRLFIGITEGSRRINAIINNMKDFVRSDNENLYGCVDINKIIQDAASILWHHIHKHTDNFHLSLGDALPPAKGNGQQIEQVIINLIMNSLQALPDKNCGVFVDTSLDQMNGCIAVTVRDEGSGMSRKVLERVTEPFFSTRIEEGGTGLGLYISSSIIKEHNGSLEFESAPGKGTTAMIRLPMAEI